MFWECVWNNIAAYGCTVWPSHSVYVVIMSFIVLLTISRSVATFALKVGLCYIDVTRKISIIQL